MLQKKNYAPLLICLCVLCQNPIWPIWHVGIPLSYVFLMFLFLLKHKKILDRLRKLSVVVALSLWSVIFVFFPLFRGMHFSHILILLSFLIAFSLTDYEKDKALKYITSSVYYIIVISLPTWLIHTFFLELPSFGILDLSSLKGSFYPMNNHLLFVTFAVLDTNIRFYSMFDEPGVLGTLSAFILFGNRYNFHDKKNWIILLGGIFTYSLAFYVLSFLGYLCMNLHSIKKIVASCIVISFIGLSVFYLLQDNIGFQRSVITRFSRSNAENFENRTGYRATLFYEQNFYSTDIFFGIGYNKMMNEHLKKGESYKLFIIENGLVGMIVLMIVYLLLAGKLNSLIIAFYMLFFLSFTQRPFAFTVWQAFLFVCVVNAFRGDEKYACDQLLKKKIQ